MIWCGKARKNRAKERAVIPVRQFQPNIGTKPWRDTHAFRRQNAEADDPPIR
jgi:hypothetical protein